MSYFVIRIELHGVGHDSGDYTNLHTQMSKRGFSRTIPGSDGKTYHLPRADYFIDGNYSIDTVRTSARDAGNAIGYEVFPGTTATAKTFGIIVTEGPSGWLGLKPVNHTTDS